MECGICGFFQKAYLIPVSRVFHSANGDFSPRSPKVPNPTFVIGCNKQTSLLREFVMEGRKERTGVSRGEGVGEADVQSGGVGG